MGRPLVSVVGGVVWVATDLLFATTFWLPIDVIPLQTFRGGDVIPLQTFGGGLMSNMILLRKMKNEAGAIGQKWPGA